MKTAINKNNSKQNKAIKTFIFFIIVVISIITITFIFGLFSNSIPEDIAILLITYFPFMILIGYWSQDIFPNKKIFIPLYTAINILILLEIFIIFYLKAIHLPSNKITILVLYILHFLLLLFLYKNLEKRLLIKTANKYNKVIRVKPDSLEDTYNLGLAYKKLDKFKEAAHAFKEAIRIKHDFAEAHYELGYCYFILGNNTEAVGAFKKAIEIKHDFAEAHYELGTNYYLLKDKEATLKEYEILKILNPQLAKELREFMDDIDKLYKRGKIIG